MSIMCKSIKIAISASCLIAAMSVYAGYVPVTSTATTTATSTTACMSDSQATLGKEYLQCINTENTKVSSCKDDYSNNKITGLTSSQKSALEKKLNDELAQGQKCQSQSASTCEKKYPGGKAASDKLSTCTMGNPVATGGAVTLK